MCIYLYLLTLRNVPTGLHHVRGVFISVILAECEQIIIEAVCGVLIQQLSLLNSKIGVSIELVRGAVVSHLFILVEVPRVREFNGFKFAAVIASHVELSIVTVY